MYKRASDSWLRHWDFILLDLAVLQLSYVMSCVLRNGLQNPYGTSFYLNTALMICMADICAAFLFEGYRGIMRRGRYQEFRAVLKHVVSVCAIEAVYLFLSKSADKFSRISFVSFVVLSILLLYAERCLWKHYLLRHKKISYRKRALIVVTVSPMADEVLRTVQANTFNELEIIGVILTDRGDLVGTDLQGIPVLCTKEELPEYIRTRWVDDVLVEQGDGRGMPGHFTELCVNMGVAVHTGIARAAEPSTNRQLDRVGGYLVLSQMLRLISRRQMAAKRLMDIAGAAVGLILTGLVTIFLAPAIYLASPGPIFFSQIRVGRNGRKFKIYKFRSMYMDAEQRKKELMEKNEMKGFMFKMEADPRIIGSGPDGTKRGLGWFIRKTSMDELPQFLNILKGDMSLVGTRPPTVDEWERYDYHHRGRMAVKPGLTGLWQVSGRNDITDFEEVVRLDKEYIQNWNLGLDVKILLQTVLVVLRGDGAR